MLKSYKKRPYSPRQCVRDYVVRAGKVISPAHQQVLAYLSSGWWLAFHSQPLLDEELVFFDSGPLFLSLHNWPVWNIPVSYAGQDRIPAEDLEVQSFLHWIWKTYGGELEAALHPMMTRPRSPWQRLVQMYSYRVPPHSVIPNQLLGEQFQRIADEYNIRIAA